MELRLQWCQAGSKHCGTGSDKREVRHVLVYYAGSCCCSDSRTSYRCCRLMRSIEGLRLPLKCSRPEDE